MEKLYVFGTGNANATHYYNTCFALRDGDQYFMVDAGGGNGILRILEDMKIDYPQIHHLFVTHEHRLPVGIQSFEEIRVQGCLYVDKTDIIWQLANRGKKYNYLLFVVYYTL